VRKKAAKFSDIKYIQFSLGVMVPICNPCTLEAEGRELQAQGQPGQHSEFEASLSQK
jgi:hypothetical protein